MAASIGSSQLAGPSTHKIMEPFPEGRDAEMSHLLNAIEEDNFPQIGRLIGIKVVEERSFIAELLVCLRERAERCGYKGREIRVLASLCLGMLAHQNKLTANDHQYWGSIVDDSAFDDDLIADVYSAPDGSFIRMLGEFRVDGRGIMSSCRQKVIDRNEPSVGLAYATLPRNKSSSAVKHQTIQEKWFCVAGKGEFWLKNGDEEEVISLSPGVTLTIPTGACFQFRNTGSDPLKTLIVTIPIWPGADEAIIVTNHWDFT